MPFSGSLTLLEQLDEMNKNNQELKEENERLRSEIDELKMQENDDDDDDHSSKKRYLILKIVYSNINFI